MPMDQPTVNAIVAEDWNKLNKRSHLFAVYRQCRNVQSFWQRIFTFLSPLTADLSKAPSEGVGAKSQRQTHQYTNVEFNCTYVLQRLLKLVILASYLIVVQIMAWYRRLLHFAKSESLLELIQIDGVINFCLCHF